MAALSALLLSGCALDQYISKKPPLNQFYDSLVAGASSNGVSTEIASLNRQASDEGNHAREAVIRLRLAELHVHQKNESKDCQAARREILGSMGLIRGLFVSSSELKDYVHLLASAEDHIQKACSAECNARSDERLERELRN